MTLKHLRSVNENMGRNLGSLLLLFSILWISQAAILSPISDAHRSASLELVTPVDGSFGSLEEAYQSLRTFELLGIEKLDIKASTCKSVVDIIWSPSSSLKDLFHASRVNGQLKCESNVEAFGGIASRLKDSVNGANSLLDFYFTIGSLVEIKNQNFDVDVLLEDADGIFRSVKALSQSDGRWRYSSDKPEPSTFAAGLALETIAGVVSLGSSEIDQSLISALKNDILKLFDGIEKYDDGALYFDEKHLDVHGHQGPLSATSSVVRGLTAFASVSSESINLSGDKLLGLAKFFLSHGIPGNAKDLYYQIDALGCLEKNRISIPLILSLQASLLSRTKKDQLKVRVTTALGSVPPPQLSVKLKQVFVSGSKDASIIDQELQFDHENALHFLDALPDTVDVGNYIFTFEIVFHDSENKKLYATGGRTKFPIYISGVINVDNAEIAVVNNDGSADSQKKLDLAGENSVALWANHLQKLRLSYQLTTPLGHAFKPHQVLLKLIHEGNIEHIFLLGNSGKTYEIILDFLGLVEKFYFLSGKYDIQLTVGDAVMENSFLQPLGFVELDLPDAPEKAPHPPTQYVDPYLRYGPKQEIIHIFREAEKRPPQELSFTFLGIVFLPFIGLLVGLLRLGVNLKNFPTSTVPAIFAILFHVGIAAVLVLYVLFWLKFDLFTTLKVLGFLVVFLMFVGHRTLSHLATKSSKFKSA